MDEQHELTDDNIIVIVPGAEVEERGENNAESELLTIIHSEKVEILEFEAALTYVKQQLT